MNWSLIFVQIFCRYHNEITSRRNHEFLLFTQYCCHESLIFWQLQREWKMRGLVWVSLDTQLKQITRDLNSVSITNVYIPNKLTAVCQGEVGPIGKNDFPRPRTAMISLHMQHLEMNQQSFSWCHHNCSSIFQIYFGSCESGISVDPQAWVAPRLV